MRHAADQGQNHSAARHGGWRTRTKTRPQPDLAHLDQRRA